MVTRLLTASFMLALLMRCTCPSSTQQATKSVEVTPPSAPDAGAPAAERPPGYEVEVEGTLNVPKGLRAERYAIFLTPEPCAFDRLDTLHLSSLTHRDPPAEAIHIYLEPVVWNHDKLNLCAVAIDGTRTGLVGFATYERNPIEFVKPPEEHELKLKGFSLTLRPVTPLYKLRTDRFW